jgi:hypothetical protein
VAESPWVIEDNVIPGMACTDTLADTCSEQAMKRLGALKILECRRQLVLSVVLPQLCVMLMSNELQGREAPSRNERRSE